MAGSDDSGLQAEEKPLTDKQLQVAKYLGVNAYRPGAHQRGVIKGAVTKFGVPKQTIHDWTKLPAFIEAIEAVEATRLAAAFEGLEELLRGRTVKGPKGDVWYPPNITAIIFEIKRQRPDADDHLRAIERRYQLERELRNSAGDNPVTNPPRPVFRETSRGERISATHTEEELQ